MDKDIINILKKSFISQQSLTSEEQRIFDEWMKEAGNRQKLYEWQRLESAIYALGTSRKVNSEEGWKKINKRIRRHHLRLLPYAAAAIVVLCLGTAIHLLTSQVATPPLLSSVNRQENPVTKQVTLTLSTGRQIPLSDSLSTMREANGTDIQITGNQLVYNTTDSTSIPVYNTITIPRGGEYKLVLADHTIVWLNSESQLTYPVAFNSDTRELRLKGEAFFEVAKDTHKPFIVHTSEMEVQALGTAFEVFDYDIESKSETVLLNGKVKIGINNSKGDRAEFILSPNEKMVYDQQADSAYVLTVDADKYTSWRKQKIVSFENEKLSMIIPRLEQWYGRKIMCQQDLADKYRFTFKVRDESLERILFMMGESSPLKYQKTSNGNYVLVLK
mgnify:CR=1 FL=1